jgi:hypothetical protein
MVIIVNTPLIVVFLFTMDLAFMIVALAIGIIVLFLSSISRGRVSTDLYDYYENKCFYLLFGMTKNDVEGFRKSRGIS